MLKRKYKITDDGRTVKPSFFKMITLENGFSLSDNIKYRYFDTTMDYLQRIIGKFNFRDGREKKKTVIPFMDIVNCPGGNYQQGYYYAQRDKIISVIRKAKDDTRKMYIGYDLMTAEEKQIVRTIAQEIKQGCVEEIEQMSSCPSTMYLVLKELDNKDFKDVARYVFDVLFGRPDQAFFSMIKASRETIYTLKEADGGDICLYGFSFEKVPLVRAS